MRSTSRGRALRRQARLRPQPLVALVHLPEVVRARVARLEEMRVEPADQRHVGGIEPDDASAALVDVTVPAHGRREDEVALAHLAAPAIDDCGGAVCLGGEADRRAGVTMRAGAVAGLEHGEGREHGARGRGLAADTRRGENERAALDVVDRDFLDGSVQERLYVTPE